MEPSRSDGNVIHPRQLNPLDSRMRRVLIQLSLISAIPAATYDRTAGSDDDPLGRRPPGDYGYDEYARWYGPPFADSPGCATDREREDCIQAAEKELAHLRRHEPADLERVETHDQTRERMLRETEGWSLQDVAQSSWRVSVTIMRRARIAAGRDPETGLTVHHDDTPGIDLASRAQQLKQQGMSLRQIALVLSVHKFQVQRLLNRAA